MARGTWTETDWVEWRDERAGIAEYDGERPRQEAERMTTEREMELRGDTGVPEQQDLFGAPAEVVV